MSFDSYDGGLPGLSDEELMRIYGLAKRDHCYDGPIDDWPSAERAATVAGLRAVIAADRARCQPVPPGPEGPTDEEILAMKSWSGHAFESDLVGFARAVLARWGRSDGPAVPDDREPASVAFKDSDAGPADGEVAELATAEMVRQLRTKAATEKANRYHYSSKLLARAADLLERLSPPQPVPVSERLPGPGDCDAEGCIWLWDSDRRWVRQKREAASLNTWVGSYWLPAHALPLPGEVEHG